MIKELADAEWNRGVSTSSTPDKATGPEAGDQNRDRDDQLYPWTEDRELDDKIDRWLTDDTGAEK